MRITDWPAALEAAGIKVKLHDGWRARGRSFGVDKVKIVWHHDASPPGDSPGVVRYMINNYSRAAAQIWVDRYGTWHFIASGVAPHAGRVRAGMPGNSTSVGIETDHTTGEDWPPALLDSLRKGTAVLLAKQGVGTDWLHFHKTICSPPGRKNDPAGLDLGSERERVAGIDDKPPAYNPKTVPTVPKQLDADGDLGSLTVVKLEAALGVPLTGRVGWRGKYLPKFPELTTHAIQKLTDRPITDRLDRGDVKALQEYLNHYEVVVSKRSSIDMDGLWGAQTTRSLQLALNYGYLKPKPRSKTVTPGANRL